MPIKSLKSNGNLRKPVYMMRLVTGYLQIGSDLLALTGKKNYEFLKIEKSQKWAILVFFGHTTFGKQWEPKKTCLYDAHSHKLSPDRLRSSGTHGQKKL